MLVGETFHEELAEILRRRSDRATVVPVAQLKADMERRLLKRLRESRNADWAKHGDVKNYAILFEDYYQSGVSEAQQADAVSWLQQCVDGLAASPFGRRTFAVSTKQLRFIDPRSIDHKRIAFNGMVLYASPDLVVEDPQGGYHIIDWKTGKTFKTNLAQLAVYGLFVQEKFGQPLERMTAHLIYVAAQRHEIINNIAEGVEEAKREIETYVADVQARLTDVSANLAADIGRFPMTENRALCKTCNFRELCDRIDEPAVVPEHDE
ncbi:MAG: PD-(D/E)XK nuclease family protein [Candidatus Eremiobacteraeota bacterium]|nr:PD-(D/E)XK nuclease family protein [Candidatus Eremiobacteraeota bacterium]